MGTLGIPPFLTGNESFKTPTQKFAVFFWHKNYRKHSPWHRSGFHTVQLECARFHAFWWCADVTILNSKMLLFCLCSSILAGCWPNGRLQRVAMGYVSTAAAPATRSLSTRSVANHPPHAAITLALNLDRKPLELLSFQLHVCKVQTTWSHTEATLRHLHTCIFEHVKL